MNETPHQTLSESVPLVEQGLENFEDAARAHRAHVWVESGVRRYEPNWVEDKSDGIAIVSGGMDSVTMAYHLVKLNHKPHLLSFDYGQRHKKELEFALWHAEALGLRWSLIDLTSITDLISNSALTSPKEDKFVTEASEAGERILLGVTGRAIEIPEGHYAEDNMRITVVPNRNMVMLSIATAVAVNNRYKYVAAGMHAGDHFQYPDCRANFIHAYLNAVERANEGFLLPNFEIKTPFIHLSKDDIAEEAYRCKVPLHMTWSCYKGGDVHCGKCATCVERLEAINSVYENHAPLHDWDQTKYADTNFWRHTVDEWNASR